MTKMMLIDAVHPEEVRVAVVDRGQVEDFDFESAKKKQLRGNIYLAKVTRVEPSLQAAFVDFGGNRHGFLAFSEIHPDYYQLPQADREALLAEHGMSSSDADDIDDEDSLDNDDDEDVRPKRKNSSQKKYKIQEVIRRRQIMLVQAVKEERGTKGAALTTYLSLAGRYCVLMPNTPRGGGISRKITNAADRKRLKKIVADLNVPEGMGLIVRTAGAKRTKSEIKRDFEYLIRLWNKIRELTLSSVAPCVINEEAGLVHRALRDLYDKDIEQVLIDGDNAYREAKDLAKMLMPSHAKKVQQHKTGTPIFAEQQIESQLNTIFNPVVNLRSGGYLVIHQTEALVAIDVNSGKATKERNIEQTALRTNLEAAEEACRQMRLRDLAGLVVIDFIDMEENKNNRAVERRIKDCLKHDRARVQYNKISMFGLMEISRQRRRAGVLDSSSEPCSHCNGTGHVRSIESSALQLLRALEGRCAGLESGIVTAIAPTEVVIYLLNEKRGSLSTLEERHNLTVQIDAKSGMLNGDFEVRVETLDGTVVEERKPAPPSRREESRSHDDDAGSGSGKRRRRSKSDRKSDSLEVLDAKDADGEASADSGPMNIVDGEKADGEEGGNRKRRRRGRRGGRRRKRSDQTPEIIELNDEVATEDGGAVLDAAASNVASLIDETIQVAAVKIVEETVSEPVADKATDEPVQTEDSSEQSDQNSDNSTSDSGTSADKSAEADATVETAESEAMDPLPVIDTSDIAAETTEAIIAEPVTSDVVEEVVAEPSAEIVSIDAVQSDENSSPEESATKAEPAGPEADAEEEPAVLPETEKPKTIRRGWWRRRKTG